MKSFSTILTKYKSVKHFSKNATDSGSPYDPSASFYLYITAQVFFHALNASSFHISKA
jgi:hypothetical protein